MHSTNNNFDPIEIDKFNKQARQWWDKNGSMKTLHAINPLRYQFIQQHANLEKKYVLDIGCGGGILTESLAKGGAIATGIDLAKENILIAQQHALKEKLNIVYECIALEDFAQTRMQSFDIITCMELLEHVPHPNSVVKRCGQLLKPGGHAFFSTINRNIKSFLLNIIGAEYILRLLPKGTHAYDKFIKPSELDRWACEANLNCQHITGIHYHPITKQFSLGPGVDANYLIHYVKN